MWFPYDLVEDKRGKTSLEVFWFHLLKANKWSWVGLSNQDWVIDTHMTLRGERMKNIKSLHFFTWDPCDSILHLSLKNWIVFGLLPSCQATICYPLFILSIIYFACHNTSMTGCQGASFPLSCVDAPGLSCLRIIWNLKGTREELWSSVGMPVPLKTQKGRGSG